MTMLWATISVPILGAAVVPLLRGFPRTLHALALIMVAATGVMALAALGSWALLVALAAFLAILGVDMKTDGVGSIGFALLLLGMMLGALGQEPRLAAGCLMILMTVVAGLLWQAARRDPAYKQVPAVTMAVGLVTVAAGSLPSPFQPVLLLLASATLLPLFPLHGAYMGALVSLPGTLPAFLAVAFPVLGWAGVLSHLHDVPAFSWWPILGLAVGGAFYGFFRATVELTIPRVLGAISLALYGVAWWHVARTAGQGPEVGMYIGAVALAIHGLVLAAYYLHARYGLLDFEKMRGLAAPMPRFAVLVALLVMAAMGLPMFGVFSGFIGVLLAQSATLSASLPVILLIWLLTSWTLLWVMQRLLFGAARTDVPYADLTRAESLSLVLVLLFLLFVGMAPDWFASLSQDATLDAAAHVPRDWRFP